MKEAAEAESGKTESTEKSGQGKEFYTIPVSYTHLDVYKRQITELDAATLNRLIKEIVVHERIDEDKTRHRCV